MSKHIENTELVDEQAPSIVNTAHRRDISESFHFNGCNVSFSFVSEDTEGIIRTVKEILLSSYRTKMSAS